MIEFLESQPVWMRETLSIGLDLALKSSALLFLAWTIHFALGQRRALARSAMWESCLIALLLLPVTLALPRLRIDILPRPEPRIERERIPASAPPLVSRVTEAEPHEREVSMPPSMIVSALDFYEQMVVMPRSLPHPDPLPTPLPQRSAPIAPVPTPKAVEAPAAEAQTGMNWLILFPVTYGFGVLLLSARLLASILAVRRLRRTATALRDPTWLADLDRWRDQLGIPRPVRLATSERVPVPVVIGWLQPLILLPKALTGPVEDSVRSAVLVHELAHVRRHDYFWNLLLRVVRLLYWPHPLAWPIGRAVASVREQACDDLCVHYLGGSNGYRSTLLDLASNLVRAPNPSLGLAMARPGRLRRRLAWIDRTNGASRCLLRWPLRLAIVLVVAVSAGMLGVLEFTRAAVPPQDEVEQRAETPKEVAQEPVEICEVTVIAQDTGETLAGAYLQYGHDFDEIVVRTDENGKAKVDYSGQHVFKGSLRLDAWAEGYVQQRQTFSDHDSRDPPIPEQTIFELVPGNESFGGLVQNEQGVPVSEVQVRLWGYLAEKQHPDELAWNVSTTTDADGRWQSSSFRPMQWVNIALSHPDYISDVNYTTRGRVPLDELKEGTNVQVMTPGVHVSGRVLDGEEKPLDGATLSWGPRDTQLQLQVAKTTTDAEGRFEFPHLPPGEVLLLAKAKGYAPDVIATRMEPDGEPVEVEFQLEPGRVLEGRVMDPEGNPIPNAQVYPSLWRGIRFLHDFQLTDDEGRYRWDSAPPDPFRIGVGRQGYLSPEAVEVIADGRDWNFTLRPLARLDGSVTDAETGELVGSGKVTVGYIERETGQVHWHEPRIPLLVRGRYQSGIDVTEQKPFKLRFEVEGYEPHESPIFEPEHGWLRYSVKLSRVEVEVEKGPTGRILQPDGQPLAGATVAVTTSGPTRSRSTLNHAEFRNPSDRVGRIEVKTGPDGRFTLPPIPEPFEFIVLSDDFFALVTDEQLRDNPEQTAQPWGRIEGQLWIGSNPGAHQTMSLSTDPHLWRTLSVMNTDETRTDADGRFTFRHVLPGEVQVRHVLGSRSDTDGIRDFAYFKIEAGEIQEVRIGGEGRPIIGRIEAPEDFGRPIDFSSASFRVQVQQNRPQSYIPPGAFRSDQPSVRVREARGTPEAIQYANSHVSIGLFRLRADGTFRIEDIPSGTYRLELNVNSPARTNPMGRDLAPLRFFFKVPEIPGGRSDEPLDIGTWKMHMRRPLKAGDPAPPFEVETLDGRTVKLEDYRGKLLLITSWAPWWSPHTFVPLLKQIRERFSEEDLAILFFYSDLEPDEARRVAEELGLPGDVGFLGQWSTSPIVAAYDMDLHSWAVLIGRDGTVIHGSKDRWYVGSFESAVAEALANE